MATAFLLSACDQKENTAETQGVEQKQEMTLSAVNPTVRKSTGPNTAAYMTIKQAGNEPDALVKVECEHATLVELHDHVSQDGVMKMTPVEKITIPGNGEVELKSGSLHIMLLGLKESFQTQDKILLTLHFEKAGKLEVACDLIDNPAEAAAQETQEDKPADATPSDENKEQTGVSASSDAANAQEKKDCECKDTKEEVKAEGTDQAPAVASAPAAVESESAQPAATQPAQANVESAPQPAQEKTEEVPSGSNSASPVANAAEPAQEAAQTPVEKVEIQKEQDKQETPAAQAPVEKEASKEQL